MNQKMSTNDNSDKGGALGRGLKVLMALNDLETGTVAGLVQETKLPKPTLIRLLQNLVDLGYAAHDDETSTYAVTSKVASLSRGLVGRGPGDSELQNILDKMADELKWPTEFLVRDGASMVIETNNRARAPIKLKLFERRRFPMLASAAGIAVLASRTLGERETEIKRLTGNEFEEAEARNWVERSVANGYAQRPLAELGENMTVSAVAIPEHSAAVSLVYFEDVLDSSAFVSRILPHLRKRASEIATVLTQSK